MLGWYIPAYICAYNMHIYIHLQTIFINGNLFNIKVCHEITDIYTDVDLMVYAYAFFYNFLAFNTLCLKQSQYVTWLLIQTILTPWNHCMRSNFYYMNNKTLFNNKHWIQKSNKIFWTILNSKVAYYCLFVAILYDWIIGKKLWKKCILILVCKIITMTNIINLPHIKVANHP